MSEFKGTKGKWTYEYDGDGMRFSEISCFIDDTYENYKEDALLISKATEMLEMLKKHLSILYDIEMEDSGDNIYVKNLIIETKQLIKQATEL